MSSSPPSRSLIPHWRKAGPKTETRPKRAPSENGGAGADSGGKKPSAPNRHRRLTCDARIVEIDWTRRGTLTLSSGATIRTSYDKKPCREHQFRGRNKDRAGAAPKPAPPRSQTLRLCASAVIVPWPERCSALAAFGINEGGPGAKRKTQRGRSAEQLQPARAPFSPLTLHWLDRLLRSHDQRKSRKAEFRSAVQGAWLCCNANAGIGKGIQPRRT